MELTAEEIQQHYNAAMDSVNLINGAKPEDMSDEDWADTVQRNKDHLRIQLDKAEMYVGFDLKPFEDAIAK